MKLLEKLDSVYNSVNELKTSMKELKIESEKTEISAAPAIWKPLNIIPVARSKAKADVEEKPKEEEGKKEENKNSKEDEK